MKRTTREYKDVRIGGEPIIDPDRVQRPAFVLFQRFAIHDGAPHRHRKGQLMYVSEGTLRVETDTGLWVVLPQRAVWLPPEVEHRGISRRGFALCNLYVDAKSARVLPDRCCTVTITPLVRELLLQGARFGARYPRSGPQMRMMSVLLEQIATLPHAPLYLPEPKDRRLRQITAALRANPTSDETLEHWAGRVGASSRTLARLFAKETKLTFAAWRQQLRVLVAIEALAHGQSVTTAALEAGYQDVSSFISVFRRVLGTTPGRYFERAGIPVAMSPEEERRALA